MTSLLCTPNLLVQNNDVKKARWYWIRYIICKSYSAYCLQSKSVDGQLFISPRQLAIVPLNTNFLVQNNDVTSYMRSCPLHKSLERIKYGLPITFPWLLLAWYIMWILWFLSVTAGIRSKTSKIKILGYLLSFNLQKANMILFIVISNPKSFSNICLR